MQLVSYVRRAAVLGAGRLGPLLAAHLANAGVEVWLYDLPCAGEDRLAPLRQKIHQLHRQSPPALAEAGRAGLIHPVCFGEGLEALRQCDLVLEAVAEDLDVKTGLYARITPFLGSRAILATTTTSLSVNTLAHALPEVLRWRFCGLHCLFPPRYMPLVELVPNDLTDPRVLDRLEAFLVTDLGKGVIRVRDRPYFVAARLGLYAMLLGAHHGERLGLAPDLVDALTGPALGRPRSGTFGLMELVGLDTVVAWLKNAWRRLPEDAWMANFRLPRWLFERLERGEPLYRRGTDGVQVWDARRGDYRPLNNTLAASLRGALAITEPAERWAALRADEHPQARFLWAMQRDLYHYAATWLGEIADSARDLDLALRWGLGWREGLLETWQSSGWRRVAGWLEEDIAAGRTLVQAPLPEWVGRVSGVHGPRGSLAPADNRPRPRSALAVYQRQLLPETLAGETPPTLGKLAWQQGPVQLLDSGDELGVIDWTAASPALDSRTVESLHEALEQAHDRFRGVVLWRGGGVFSCGADLTELLTLLDRRDRAALVRLLERWQDWLNACRDTPLPVVAAVQGRCFGLGAATLLYCDRVVAALESRYALVVPRLGLPPGGGVAALARRAYRQAGAQALPLLLRVWPWLAAGSVARSGLEARQLGLLTEADPVVMNPQELLFIARRQAAVLADSAYRTPPEPPLPVAGEAGLTALRQPLERWRAAGALDARQARLAEELARVLVGGEVAAGSLLDEPAHRQLEAAQWQDWLESGETREQLLRHLEG